MIVAIKQRRWFTDSPKHLWRLWSFGLLSTLFYWTSALNSERIKDFFMTATTSSPNFAGLQAARKSSLCQISSHHKCIREWNKCKDAEVQFEVHLIGEWVGTCPPVGPCHRSVVVADHHTAARRAFRLRDQHHFLLSKRCESDCVA